MKRTSLHMFIALAILLCTALAPAHSESRNVVFHFYGAVDCAPCMTFKKSNLPQVEAKAKQSGFQVAVNIIDKSRDIEHQGIYGQADKILRRAAKKLSVVYPPIFFVSRNGEIVSAYRSNWKTALADAEGEAMR